MPCATSRRGTEAGVDFPLAARPRENDFRLRRGGPHRSDGTPQELAALGTTVVASVSTATLLRLVLNPLLGERAVFLTIPAIALTAYASDRDRSDALEAGYFEHVAKPVQPYHLARLIVRAVRPGLTAAATALPKAVSG